jgi:hypothetical protein
MIHAYARRQGDTPALAPKRMARAALDEGIGFAGVIAGGRDRQRIEPSLLDRATNTRQRQFAFEQGTQRRSVQQRLHAPGAEQRREGGIAHQPAGVDCQRPQIGAIDLRGGQAGP